MSIFETKDSGARENLANGMMRDVETDKIDYTLLLDGPLLERWAALLARGAAKYGPRNWTKALESTDAAAREVTTERFRRSAFRHMMQWLAGDRSEDHAAAVLFNLNGAESMRDTAGLAAAIATAPDGTISHGVGVSRRELKVGDRVRVLAHRGRIGRCGTITLEARPEHLDLEVIPGANATPACETSTAEATDSAKREVRREPKVGDRVEITSTLDGHEHLIGAVGTLVAIEGYFEPFKVYVDDHDCGRWATGVKVIP